MVGDDSRPHRRCTALRKLSRQKRETRAATGNLDADLDFICPFCNNVYSLFRGRHKLHLQKCKHRIAQAVASPRKLPLPSPPPFEIEVFPTPVAAGEYDTVRLFPPLSIVFQDPGGQDVEMQEGHEDTSVDYQGNSLPLGFSGDVEVAHVFPSTGVYPAVTLQPGETLVISHPHSQCPMRIIPTTPNPGARRRW
jgi:hypothetical protein